MTATSGSPPASGVPPIYLTGIALWSPGHRDLASFVRGERDESVVDCASPWVPPRLMRGASRLTRMLGEVAASACVVGEADRRTVSTIYASSYGEIETMVVLLETIFAGDGQLSPMRFKNSVHNSASGLGSIGTGNQGFSTALAAGDRSAEAAMIEVAMLLADTGTRPGPEAVIAIDDDRLPEPLAARDRREGLAIGLCLTTDRPARGALAVIDELRQDDDAVALPATFAGRALGETLLANPTAHALPLVEHVLARREGRVALAYDVPRPFSVRVRPDAREPDVRI